MQRPLKVHLEWAVHDLQQHIRWMEGKIRKAMIHNHETSEKWLVMIGAGESSIDKIYQPYLARQEWMWFRPVWVDAPLPPKGWYGSGSTPSKDPIPFDPDYGQADAETEGKVTEEMLREAARQAKETGRQITITLPNGMPFTIS